MSWETGYQQESIRVNPQNLPGQGGSVLGGRLAGITSRDVELPIRSELEPTPIVDGCAGDAVEKNAVHLPPPSAFHHRHYAIPQPSVLLIGVIDVHKTSPGEIRGKKQTQEATLSNMRHGECRPRLGVQLTIVDNADMTRALH